MAVLDVCVGTGLLDVRVEGGELALRLLTPEGPPPLFRPGDPEPRDWSTPVALGIGAAAAVIAFALGRLRGRPRGRPRGAAPT